MLLFVVSLFACHSVGADEKSLPELNEVQRAIDAAVADAPALRPGALVCQGEGAIIFARLEGIGWKVADKREILADLLPAGSPLVITLRSPRGQKFASQVADYKLIYDRLDRISQEPGGQRLLQDLVKLPDAARYAKQVTGRGVPDLVELLPKQRSGKTRRVQDYDKPTKKIYTLEQLQKRIRESYEQARQELNQ
jgi:hypothetical protein